MRKTLPRHAAGAALILSVAFASPSGGQLREDAFGVFYGYTPLSGLKNLAPESYLRGRDVGFSTLDLWASAPPLPVTGETQLFSVLSYQQFAFHYELDEAIDENRPTIYTEST